jgi:hypothetical protein
MAVKRSGTSPNGESAEPANPDSAGLGQSASASNDSQSPLDALSQGRVALYDFKGDHLPDVISEKNAGAVSYFLKEGKATKGNTQGFHIRRYKRITEIRYEQADVHLLDGAAIKLLLMRLPSNSRYVMVRLALRLSWIVGSIGLLRRFLLGQVKLRGIAKLKSSGKTQRWIVVEHVKYSSRGLSLSSEVGIQGFLDHLRVKDVRYVVSRFYEKLPELYRAGGDLDLLVEDGDEEKIKSFLSAHPGYIGVDAYTASSGYFPVHLTTQMIQNSVDGPAGSRIPTAKEAFLSFAYHAVYHKGYRSGIPSALADTNVSTIPDNDYAGILMKMAQNLGIQVPMDMESLDEMLETEGWRPDQPHLAVIATHNDWVRHRFSPHRHTDEIGLGVMIFKEKAFRLGVVDSVLREIERQAFTILGKKAFDEDGKKTARELLRGGNWNSLDGVSHQDYLPAMIVAILDTRPSSLHRAARGSGLRRIDPLKMKLRKIFDDEPSSIIHSTDYSYEAWEYIEVCIPEEIASIAEKIKEHFRVFDATDAKKVRSVLEWDFRRTLRIRALRRRGRNIVLRLMS